MKKIKLVYSIIAGIQCGIGMFYLGSNEIGMGIILLFGALFWFAWVILWSVMFPPIRKES